MIGTKETMVAVIDGVAFDQQERELALSEQVTEIEFQAGAITIDTDDDYQNAAAFGGMLRQRTSDVKEFWKPMKDAAHKAHAEICGKEKAMLQPLENAARILKQTMGAYVAEQERKRREAEEAARKAAQEEVERKMAEAIELEEKGDTVAAEAAVEEAEIMDNAASTVSVASTKPKASGVTTKKDWKIVAIDSDKVPTKCMGIDIRPVDAAAVMRLIRMSKGQVSIPGIQFKETVQISFRK